MKNALGFDAAFLDIKTLFIPMNLTFNSSLKIIYSKEMVSQVRRNPTTFPYILFLNLMNCQ